MNAFRTLLLVYTLLTPAFAQQPRLIVTTDLGQDPDDQQSLVRLLHYANEFDLEGIILNADANADYEAATLKPEIAYELLDAYATIQPRLLRHAERYPSASVLKAIVKEGLAGASRARAPESYLGEGQDTEGSEWIVKMLEKDDPRPLHVRVWGGACDLAQALWHIREEYPPEEATRLIRKLRVYFIGTQDSSNEWIIEQFPELWVILALDRGGNNWHSTYRGMFWGGDMSNTSAEWLQTYVLGGNELASLYPPRAWTGREDKNPHSALKEGDTPAFLYFLSNGLNFPEHPHWGGWGGRFTPTRERLFRDTADLVFDAQYGKDTLSQRATVFRWRTDFQHDFANRIRWGASDTTLPANHAPQIVLNGSTGHRPLFLAATPNQPITLDAHASSDPDGDALDFEWTHYPEPGGNARKLSFEQPTDATLSFSVPAETGTYHLILRVQDHAELPFTAYKRVVLKVR